MPIMRCQKRGRKGWKFGATGTCYIGSGARADAWSDDIVRLLTALTLGFQTLANNGKINSF